MTLKELREKAKELNIKGRSKMGRLELEVEIHRHMLADGYKYDSNLTVESDSYSHVFSSDGNLIPVSKSIKVISENDTTENVMEKETVSLSDIIDQVSAEFVANQEPEMIETEENDGTVTDDGNEKTEEITEMEETFIPDYPSYNSFREALADQLKFVRYFRRAIARDAGDWANVMLTSHLETVRDLFADRHAYLPKKKVANA